MLEKTWRWFGPGDTVTLSDLKQMGVEGVVTSLHHLKPGEVWGTRAIGEICQLIENEGLRWSVVESLPVYEAIKKGDEKAELHIQNYIDSLHNLAANGVDRVCYNFMPVIDWVRTDLSYRDADGSETMLYDPITFALFDLFILQREDAAKDYSPEVLQAAAARFARMSESEVHTLAYNLIIVTQGFINSAVENRSDYIAAFKAALESYHRIGEQRFRENFTRFIQRVIPVAEELNIKMCIHPDDPPFPLLGLPRIASTVSDFEWIFAQAPSLHNGMTFCMGSLGARKENNLLLMLEHFADRVHFAHLRNLKHLEGGRFYESGHLDGDLDLVGVIDLLLQEQTRRIDDGRADDHYPVKGAELMNKKWLTAQRNRDYIAQERVLANELRDKAKHYYDTLYHISYEYNDLMDGKWKRIMSLRQGVTASYFEMPKLDSVAIAPKPAMGLYPEGREPLKGVSSFLSLPAFSKYFDQTTYFVDIYNKGEGSFRWKVKPSADWIRVSSKGGTVSGEERLWVSVDWSKAPLGESVQGYLEFSAGKKKEKVMVSLFNPPTPTNEELSGLFVENNGVVSIAGADFHRKRESDEVKMQLIENLGVENRAVMMGDPTGKVLNPRNHNNPAVEYDFYTFHQGPVDVYTYVLPVFPLSSDRDFNFHEQNSSQTRYAVCIDDGPVALPSSSAPEYTQTWYDNVLRNAAVNKSTFYVDQPGKHTLHIRCGDPGMVIQKIVLDFGGMKKSYTGPAITKAQ